MGCSVEKKDSNQRILNSIKLSRQYLSASNRNDLFVWQEKNKDYEKYDSTYNYILNQVEKVREINRKYTEIFEGLAVNSDSFASLFSSNQDKYKVEMLQNLNERTRASLSEIPYENILMDEKITLQSENEYELAKEAILNEIEMNNFVIPLYIYRQW